MKLTIKEGKFYRGADEVKPEFGNMEQIQCIKDTIRKLIEEQEMVEALKTGLVLDPTVTAEYTAEVDFRCECGGRVYAEACADDEDDWQALADHDITCRSCKKEYRLKVEAGDLIAFLRK